MKKIFFAIIAVLAAFNAHADRMYIDNFSIEAGETKKVSINLDNSSALSAFQLELHLPAGLSMALDSRGRLRCGVNADRADDHTLTFKDRGNGQYNATYYSTNSYDIYDNNGEVVYFYVSAAEDFSGTATVSLKEIYVSDAAGNMNQLSNTSCTVTGPQPVNPPAGPTSMYINDFSIEAGETQQVSINLDNSTALSAFQLELHLPAGLSMALDNRGRLRCGVNADRADDHTLTFKDRGNGQYNATYYSTNSYDIMGNSGEVVYFYVTAADNFTGTATVELKEIYVSDAAGNMTQLDNTTCTVTGPSTPGPEPGDEKATSIVLDMTQFKTTVTALVQVYPSIEPAAAASQTIEWTSSNEEIATVDTHGRIMALKPGRVTVTATTTDGSNLSASCEVTILRKGDMNDDFVIDVTDINSILNIMLNN